MLFNHVVLRVFPFVNFMPTPTIWLSPLAQLRPLLPLPKIPSASATVRPPYLIVL